MVSLFPERMKFFETLKRTAYTLAGFAGCALMPAFAQDGQSEEELRRTASSHYTTGLGIKGERPEQKRERLEHFLRAYVTFQKAEAADGNPDDGDHKASLESALRWIAMEHIGPEGYVNPNDTRVFTLIEKFKKTGQLPEPNAAPKPSPVPAPVRTPVRSTDEKSAGWQSWKPGERFLDPYVGGNATFMTGDDISGFVIDADGRVSLGTATDLGFRARNEDIKDDLAPNKVIDDLRDPFFPQTVNSKGDFTRQAYTLSLDGKSWEAFVNVASLEEKLNGRIFTIVVDDPFTPLLQTQEVINRTDRKEDHTALRFGYVFGPAHTHLTLADTDFEEEGETTTIDDVTGAVVFHSEVTVPFSTKIERKVYQANAEFGMSDALLGRLSVAFADQKTNGTDTSYKEFGIGTEGGFFAVEGGKRLQDNSTLKDETFYTGTAKVRASDDVMVTATFGKDAAGESFYSLNIFNKGGRKSFGGLEQEGLDRILRADRALRNDYATDPALAGFQQAAARLDVVENLSRSSISTFAVGARDVAGKTAYEILWGRGELPLIVTLHYRDKQGRAGIQKVYRLSDDVVFTAGLNIGRNTDADRTDYGILVGIATAEAPKDDFSNPD